MNIRKIKKFLEDIAKYDTYFHVHGGDVLITIFTVIILSCVFSFLEVKKKSVEIKKKWPEKRCDPSITPFAGFLNPPPGSNFKQKIQFTMDNYALCNSQVLKKNVGLFTLPLKFVQKKIRFLYDLVAKIMEIFKGTILFLKELLTNIAQFFFQKVSQIVISLQLYLIRLKDTLMKSAGMSVGMFFVTLGSAFLSMAMLNNFAITLIIVILIMFIGVQILKVIAAIPGPGIFFRIAAYITYLVIYIIYSVVATLVVIYVESIKEEKRRQDELMEETFDGCFHPNTTINTTKGFKQIKNLNIGDELDENNFVEAVIKIKAMKPLYLYKGIFITGEHCVFDKNDQLKMVKHMPNAHLTKVKSPYYYCLLTTKKNIIINNTKFADWDDLDSNDKINLGQRYNINSYLELNNKFNSGIDSNTILELNNNKTIKLKDIEIGDVLKDNNKVLAKIKVKPLNKETQYKTNNNYIYGFNLFFTDLGDKIKKLTLETKTNSNTEYYHLLTSKGYIDIYGSKLGDFNWVYENILDKYNKLFTN